MFSKFLINEHPLMFLPSLAAAIGLKEALVLQQMHFWLVHSKHRIYKHDHYWVYSSYRKLQLKFPFLTESTVEKITKSLEERRLLMCASLNTSKPRWYTINYNALNALMARINKPSQSGHTDHSTTPNQTKEDKNDATNSITTPDLR